MPLMSGTASGSFAGAMVFSRSKGRDIVRQLVTPSNPKTPAQIAVRNKLALAAIIMSVVNRTTARRSDLLVIDEVAFRNVAPSGQTWNATTSAKVIGPLGSLYAAASTAWAAVTKAAWETAAAALPVPYSNVSQTNPTGGAPIVVTAGEQYFRHQYAMFAAGIGASAPNTPPTYA